MITIVVASFAISCDDSEKLRFDEKKNVEDEHEGNKQEIPNPLTIGRDCSLGLSDDVLDIATWNLEQFPLTSSTIELVRDAVLAMDADVMAIQEISSTSAFNTLSSQLPDWDGVYENVNGGIELGFLIKKSAIISYSTTRKIFSGQTSPFPREPVLIDLEHTNGVKVTLVNLHLKCCNDGETRRNKASQLLKSELDSDPSTAYVVLGDFNDDINSGSPFSNFIADDEYLFADWMIAKSENQSEWSYPSWPSHIDHILVTSELFDMITYTQTIKLSECINGYADKVSDHRPVMIGLQGFGE